MSSPGPIDLSRLLARDHHPAHRNPVQKRRRNRFAGDCGRCGGRVPVEWGTLEEIEGRWRVVHLDGECEPLAPS